MWPGNRDQNISLSSGRDEKRTTSRKTEAGTGDSGVVVSREEREKCVRDLDLGRFGQRKRERRMR